MFAREHTRRGKAAQQNLVHPQRQSAVRRSRFRPRKSLGQHFLRDRSVLEQILRAAEILPADTVIEVGPGPGILAEALARQGARVIAVELDSRLIAPLRRRLAAYSEATIVEADILRVSPGQLLADRLPSSDLPAAYKVVANLPYYITSPVLSHFLEAEDRPERMVVMVQREVGETMVAAPGKMRLLSVKTQFYSRAAIVCHVPAASFHPVPKVDSVVVRLDVYIDPPIDVSDVAGFFEVVMHGFSAPRKQIRNAMAHSLQMSAEEVSLLLEKAGVDGTRRAETLSLEEWRAVWEAFAPCLCHDKPDECPRDSSVATLPQNDGSGE